MDREGRSTHSSYTCSLIFLFLFRWAPFFVRRIYIGSYDLIVAKGLVVSRLKVQDVRQAH